MLSTILIQENKLLQIAREAEKEYHAGRTKKLRSLADLMKANLKDYGAFMNKVNSR